MQKHQVSPWRPPLLAVALSVGAALSHAGVTTVDFNSDPVPLGIYSEPGTTSAQWRADGGFSGAAGDGYLSVTDAIDSQRGVLIFKDLDNGLVVKAFTFEVDLRIGGGENPPADGFSINYARIDDPVISRNDGSGWSGTDDEPGTDNGGTGGGLPEEGTSTGLAIGFDTWQSGLIRGVRDVTGISLRVDGNLITQFPIPIRPGNQFDPGEPNPDQNPGAAYTYDNSNGTFKDVPIGGANYLNSLQTGSINPEAPTDGSDVPASVRDLKWEKLIAEITEDGKVKITWKGVELTPAGGIQTTFSPSAGRIIFGARTGGNNENHHVDNIKLTTIPADNLIIGTATGTPIGYRFLITDTGPSVFDTADAGDLQMTLNGAPAVATSKIKDANGITTVVYQDAAAPLPIGSTNTVVVTVKDTRDISQTKTLTFVVPVYQTLAVADSVTGVDTSQAGFALRLHQSVLRDLPNTVARAEQQLHGDRGANVLDLTQPGFAGGVFSEADTVNYNQLNATSDATDGQQGFFKENLDDPALSFPDRIIPGLPGSEASFNGDSYTDNISAELVTYLQFPEVGVYTLIFNSDDGFRTTTSPNPREVLTSRILSQADVGKGSSDVNVTLYVAAAGFYPMRTVWFEGGGGANLEWSAILPSGVRALVNDSTVAGAVKAFRTRTGNTPVAVTYANPTRDSGTYPPDLTLAFDLSDGAPATVTDGTVALKLDDQPVTATVARAGALVKVTYKPATFLTPGSHAYVLGYGDNQGGTWSVTNTFTVDAWVTIPASLAMPAGSVDTSKPGFLVKTFQRTNKNGAPGRDNNVNAAELELQGLLGFPSASNVADLTLFTGPQSYYVEQATVNYSQSDASGTVATADKAGNFRDNNTAGDAAFYAQAGMEDRAIPGIPSLTDFTGTANDQPYTDNIVAEILTVAEIPAPGFYTIIFNSDDGFRTSAGHPSDKVKVEISRFDAGRGADDTAKLIYFSQAGLYPLRTIWFEGGGGANFEWSIRRASDNRRVLLNDTAQTGSIKTYQYPVGTGPAWVKKLAPAAGARHVPANRPIEVVIADGTGSVDQSSVTLSINGEAVTPTVNKASGETTVTYQTPNVAGTVYNASLKFADRTVDWSFTGGGELNVSFFIEAEDFDYNSGQSVPAASNYPGYTGGGYSGQGAVANVDYSRPSEGSSPLYRIGENPQVPMDITGDIDRGTVDLPVNYKIGWTGAGQWYNYTRTIPAGEYGVLAGLSHGDGPSNLTAISASLQRVTAGAGTTTQTVEDLGSFKAPGSGGWGNNVLVPLQDATGNAVTLNLSGATTLRMNPISGDFDFILLVAPTTPGLEANISLLPTGRIRIEYSSGTLQQANALDGGFTDVPGATSPYETDATDAQKYYSLR